MKQVDANTNSELDHHQQQQYKSSVAMDESESQSGDPSSNQVHTHRMSAYHRMIEACKQKNLTIIKSILSERPGLVNQHDKHNRTLLHYTVILFHDDNSAGTGGGNDNLPRATTDVRRKLEIERDCIECFTYLTDRCDLKLWWQQDLDGLSVLHLAVISSNVPLVKHIIFQHPYSIKYPLVCTLDNEHHSPLHWAVITNNLDCVKLLIGYAGTKLAHEPDLNGATPLHYATQTSDYPKYRQQLKLMLKNVSDSSCSASSSSPPLCSVKQQQREVDSQNTTANGEGKKEELQRQQTVDQLIGLQRSLEILEYLVRLPQINLECIDKDRRTPLLWAASSGNRDAILLLVNNGANMLSHDINRLGALHCAASHGFADCLECLLSLNNNKNSSTETTGSQMVNQPDNLNCTPLFYSVLSGNIDCVEILLDRSAKPDWQDTKGRTGAHFAALKGQLNTLKLLHERGANLWLANKQGDLPLHYAIKSGRQQVVRWLLEHSPYEHAVNAINNFGRAPIHLAILKDNVPMVDYLVRCGANLNQLVKVRDKVSNGSGTSKQTATTDLTIVNGSSVHQTKNGQYHYETALDMAKGLGHQHCLQLLLNSQAMPASQVICNRLNRAPGTSSATRSLFDLQSVEGPSPIGFETSSSSDSPSSQLATAARGGSVEESRSQQLRMMREAGTGFVGPRTISQELPKLSRPKPNPMPQTDSTGSSALSQNSLTSIRGLRPTKQQHHQQQQQQQAAFSHSAKTTTATDPSHHGFESCSRQAGTGSTRPYKGGISYNNDHINASIKCKLYEREADRPHGNHRSFPPDSHSQQNHQQQVHQQTASMSGRTSQSAPSGDRLCRSGGQEIITNVNVYTSPCAHCMHHQQAARCVQCSTSSPSALDHHRMVQYGVGQIPAKSQSGNRQVSTDVDYVYSDETSDATTESGEDTAERLPSLTEGPRMAHQQAPSGSFVRSQLRHLPPSQGHEQHLPVIVSDQELSAVNSDERSSKSPQEQDLVEEQEDQHGAAGEDERATQEAAEASSSSLAKHMLASSTSGATEEPRFDRAQRPKAAQRVDRYREQVRSPVADYIHAPISGAHDQRLRSVSLSRAMDAGGGTPVKKGGHQLPSGQRLDLTQVKAKVDSHRGSEDHSRSKSMSILSSTGTGSTHHPMAGKSPLGDGPVAPAAGSRSVSRQTVIRTRRLSVDSVELASCVEKSIRKYKQETKLFEELQNLKRSQIRSGRANEALLVKRLVEHFRHDTLDLIGLDTYHGPYTYKSYERFLYDQLRKLSQSNCAKLSKHLHQLDHLQQQQHHDHHLMDPHATEHDYLDEDLKAELELRRVIGSEGSDSESYILEPSGALEEIRVKSKDNDEEMDQDLYGKIYGKDVQRETIHHDIQDDRGEPFESSANTHDDQGRLADQGDLGGGLKSGPRRTSMSSLSSTSRKSSIELEREKLSNLPLKVSGSGTDFVENQANSLSSSIITDALGNVSRNGSRAGSPTLRRTKSLADQQQPVEDESPDDIAVSGDGATSSPMGRRRSVVNIGNKMEFIYHDVGIEIEPAQDSDHESVEPEMPLKTEKEEKESATEEEPSGKRETQTGGTSQTDRLEDVKEEEYDEEERVSSPATPPLSYQPDKQEEEQQLDPSGLPVDRISIASSESTSERSGDEISKPSDMKRKQQPELVVGASTSTTRRASSPQTYGQGAVLKGHRLEGTGSRAVSVDRSPGDGGEIKKVFNGHDLDEMRRHLRRAPLRISEHIENETETETAAEEKRSAAGGRLVKDNEGEKETRVASLDEKDMTTDHKRLVGGVTVVDGGEHSRETQPVEEPAVLARRIVGVSPIRRTRRLEPSQIPKRRYKLKVPIEEIKQRWSRIRAAERRKSLEVGGGGDVSRASESDKRLAKLTKSQPNLKRDDEGVVYDEGESEVNSSPYSNYILLYEINKSAKSSAFDVVNGVKQKRDDDYERRNGRITTTQNKWCHRRIVRIVDVRTIKRTLSLPESLIYSNDLLKRFNILKL